MCEEQVKIKFGTDGWRAVISDDFTFKNVRLVSQAISEYIKTKVKKQAQVAVGFDTRFLSREYAHLVAEVLSGNNIRVFLSNRTVPTPALSFTVKNRNLDYGVMITASHNPARYNGIKIKLNTGGAAGKDVTDEVEKILEVGVNPCSQNPELITMDDFTQDYVKFLRSYINLKVLKNAKVKALMDVMYGAGNGFIAEVLKGTSIKLEFMRSSINPSFDGKNPEPIESNLGNLIKETKARRFDIGLALDGDGDRVGASSPKGSFIHPQLILPLLVYHLVEDRKWSGGIVKTIAGSVLIDKVAKKFNLPVYETPVGFKYISNLMETKDILIGGEEAGGIGFKGYIPERDGTVASLLLLEMIAYRKKSIAKIIQDVVKEFGQYFYVRADLHLKSANKESVEKLRTLKSILNKKVIEIKDYDGIKAICDDESWLMLRASGTEPLVRVYAESSTLKKAKELLEFGKKLVL
ncbi:MAG: phosphoglucomutase/phosphomannomutase family protein [Candidatus Omnitrophota bacterium]